MTPRKKLFSYQNPSAYGAKYKEHTLALYSQYVQMADTISARRQSANSFFLTLNTVLVGLASYLSLGGPANRSSPFYFLAGIAGMIICHCWYRLIRSYRDINAAKFKVIHELERILPVAPYHAEWLALGRGNDKNIYMPFTKIEIRIPWIFFGLHAMVTLYSDPWTIVAKHLNN